MKTKSRTEHPDKRDNKIGGTPPWSEMTFRQLADNIIDGVYCINTDGYFIFMNKALSQRTGIRPEQYQHLHFLDLIDPAYHDRAKDNFQRVMEGKDGISYELRYKSDDGPVRIVEVHSRPVFESGRVVGIIGISRDVTERKLAEEMLRQSEEKYRALLENASDPILLADTQGNIIEANRKAQELWGYTKDELLQMHYTQLHPMQELKKTIASFKGISEKNTDHMSGGFIQRKDGSIVPVDITGSVIEYSGRKVIQGFFRDISEHTLAKGQLEELVKERTAELSLNNAQLKLEIKERKRAEALMKRKSRELKRHTDKLREMNAALKVLLKQREEDRAELEGKVLSNVKHLLVPHLETLKKKKLDQEAMIMVEILESNLMNIISPFSHKLSSKYMNLTPSEIKIANLIRDGKSTKEIAQFIRVSANAVNHHRHHIREKLGILTQKINLRSYLSTLV